MAKPEEITAFLKKFKPLVVSEINFIKSKDNLATISYLGLTIPDIKSILSQLTYKDYVKGPEKDNDRRGNMIWEFGVHIKSEDIYIKLSDDFSFDKAKCISFHISTPYSILLNKDDDGNNF